MTLILSAVEAENETDLRAHWHRLQIEETRWLPGLCFQGMGAPARASSGTVLVLSSCSETSYPTVWGRQVHTDGIAGSACSYPMNTQ